MLREVTRRQGPNGRCVSRWYSLDGRRRRRRVTNKCDGASPANTLLSHVHLDRLARRCSQVYVRLSFARKTKYITQLFSKATEVFHESRYPSRVRYCDRDVRLRQLVPDAL